MNTLSIIDSIRKATLKTSRLGLAIGAIVGAVVPVGVFAITHTKGVLDLSRPLWLQAPAFLVAGGLAFSAHSVVTWTERLFRNRLKAACWTLLVEGLMTFAPEQLAWLSWVCLALLVAVNAVSNGCAVALDRAEGHAQRRARGVPGATFKDEASGVNETRRSA